MRRRFASHGELTGRSSPLAEADPRPSAPAVAPRAKVERPADAKVSVLFADRLGRKLSAQEKRAADAVDELFQWHRGAGYVTESLLEPITRARAGVGLEFGADLADGAAHSMGSVALHRGVSCGGTNTPARPR